MSANLITHFPEADFYKVVVSDTLSGSMTMALSHAEAVTQAGVDNLALEWETDPERGYSTATRPDGVKVELQEIAADGPVFRALRTLFAAGINTGEKFEKAMEYYLDLGTHMADREEKVPSDSPEAFRD